MSLFCVFQLVMEWLAIILISHDVHREAAACKRLRFALQQSCVYICILKMCRICDAFQCTNQCRFHCTSILAPIGVKMGSKQVLWNCKMMRKVRKTTAFQVKYGGFMVAGEEFEPRIIVAAIEISLRLQAFCLRFLCLKILCFGGRK